MSGVELFEVSGVELFIVSSVELFIVSLSIPSTTLRDRSLHFDLVFDYAQPARKSKLMSGVELFLVSGVELFIVSGVDPFDYAQGPELAL